MRKISAWILAISFFSLIACSDSTEYDDLKGSGQISTTTTGTGGSGGTGGTGGTGGGGSTIGTDGTTVPQGTFRKEAYWDGTLILTLLMQELTTDQIAALNAQGTVIGTVYADAELNGTATFLPVAGTLSFDAPYWTYMQITFNQGVTPRQFSSAADVEAAILANEITVTNTNRVFWYELQGKRPA
jgi:hypothetical protein